MWEQQAAHYKREKGPTQQISMAIDVRGRRDTSSAHQAMWINVMDAPTGEARNSFGAQRVTTRSRGALRRQLDTIGYNASSIEVQ